MAVLISDVRRGPLDSDAAHASACWRYAVMIGALQPPPMFVDEARAAPCITARPPRPGLHQHFDAAARRHAEQAETKQPAKFAHARVALAAASSGETHGEPDLIARRHPVDALQHQFETEAELQFADDDERRFFAADRDEIAAADFALHLEAEALEEALHREVERRLPRRKLPPLRSFTWHGCPSTRTTGFACARQSRCCRNHVADVVSASLTRAASPRKPRIALAVALAGASAPPRGGTTFPL